METLLRSLFLLHYGVEWLIAHDIRKLLDLWLQAPDTFFCSVTVFGTACSTLMEEHTSQKKMSGQVGWGSKQENRARKDRLVCKQRKFLLFS